MTLSILFQLIAPGLTVSTLLLGNTWLLLLLCRRIRPHLLADSGFTPVLFSFAVVLALSLNLNLFLPGIWVFPTLLATGFAGLALAFHKSRKDPMAHAIVWVVVVGTVCAALLTTAYFFLFDGLNRWMVEGTNHDLVYYYVGARWGSHNALLVSQDQLTHALALGKCGGGLQFIGHDCSVIRFGTYSLLSIAELFHFSDSPNLMRACVSIGVLFPLLGLTGSIFESFGRKSWWPRQGVFVAVAATSVSCCVGILCAIVNENVATAFGALLLSLLVMAALQLEFKKSIDGICMGLIAGCAGIVYGEAAAIACGITAIAITLRAIEYKSFRTFLVCGATSVLAFLLVLNVTTIELVNSYTSIADVVTSRSWQSWYMHHAPVWWIAAPFTGILMTGSPQVTLPGLIVGGALSLATIGIAFWQKRGKFALAIALLCALLIKMLLYKGFEYGEHKLLQLLGVVWVTMLVGMLIPSADDRRRRLIAIAVMVCLFALSADFLKRARPIIASHDSSSISYAFATALRQVNRGDEVLIDSNAVENAEKYVRQDFAVAFIHLAGGRVKMSGTSKPPDGFTDGFVGGTALSAQSPDWLLKLKPIGEPAAIHPSYKPFAEDASFSMYALNNGHLPVALPAEGWYLCEPTQCWTTGDVTIETLVPATCGTARLEIDYSLFQPPEDGQFTVSVTGEKDRTEIAKSHSVLAVDVKAGHASIKLKPSWTVKSPKDLGLSGDARPLFASISSLRIQCLPRD